MNYEDFENHHLGFHIEEILMPKTVPANPFCDFERITFDFIARATDDLAKIINIKEDAKFHRDAIPIASKIIDSIKSSLLMINQHRLAVAATMLDWPLSAIHKFPMEIGGLIEKVWAGKFSFITDDRGAYIALFNNNVRVDTTIAAFVVMTAAFIRITKQFIEVAEQYRNDQREVMEMELLSRSVGTVTPTRGALEVGANKWFEGAKMPECNFNPKTGKQY